MVSLVDEVLRAAGILAIVCILIIAYVCVVISDDDNEP